MCSSLQGIASLAPNIIHYVYFVHRRAVPVPLWWCLAQSLTSPTQRQTARAKGEIFSLLGRRGLKTVSQQGSWRPFQMICPYMEWFKWFAHIWIWKEMHAFKCWPSLAKFDPISMKIRNHILILQWHNHIYVIFPPTAFTDHCLPDSVRARVQTTSTRLQRRWQSGSTQTRKRRGRAPSVPLPVRIWPQPQVPWFGNPATNLNTICAGWDGGGGQAKPNPSANQKAIHPSEMLSKSTWSN